MSEYDFRVPTVLPREEQEGESEMRDWLNLRHAQRMLAAIPLAVNDSEFWPRIKQRHECSTHKVDFGRQRFTITCETGHVLDFRGHLNLTFFRPAIKDNCEPIAAEIKATSDGFFCDLLVPDPPKKPPTKFHVGQVVVLKTSTPERGQLRLVYDAGETEIVRVHTTSAGWAGGRPEIFLAEEVEIYEAPAP